MNHTREYTDPMDSISQSPSPPPNLETDKIPHDGRLLTQRPGALAARFQIPPPRNGPSNNDIEKRYKIPHKRAREYSGLRAQALRSEPAAVADSLYYCYIPDCQRRTKKKGNLSTHFKTLHRDVKWNIKLVQDSLTAATAPTNRFNLPTLPVTKEISARPCRAPQVCDPAIAFTSDWRNSDSSEDKLMDISTPLSTSPVAYARKSHRNSNFRSRTETVNDAVATSAAAASRRSHPLSPRPLVWKPVPFPKIPTTIHAYSPIKAEDMIHDLESLPDAPDSSMGSGDDEDGPQVTRRTTKAKRGPTNRGRSWAVKAKANILNNPILTPRRHGRPASTSSSQITHKTSHPPNLTLTEFHQRLLVSEADIASLEIQNIKLSAEIQTLKEQIAKMQTDFDLLEGVLKHNGGE